MYTQYVENFLYTRYHDKKLHLFNAGISGDKAIDLLNRFEEDVAFQKPKWVTILIGMNDGRYQNFDQMYFKSFDVDPTTGPTISKCRNFSVISTHDASK